MKSILCLSLLLGFGCNSLHSFAASAAVGASDFSNEPLSWPAPGKESHPWTRWWWLGSAVDQTNLTRLLTEYQAAGLGGVEICSIYGAHGYENQFIDFLSPKWMEMLAHTTREAKRLGLGVDLTTGTGWPFGGPFVSDQDASARVVLKKFELSGGSKLNEAMPRGQLRCLRAVAGDGRQIDLTSRVAGGKIAWTAPEGQWRVYAVLQLGPVQKVKRAAPGGVGNVLDPYSVEALNRYLAHFDDAFAHYDGLMPRAFFHDSFEYYGAQWTDDLFSQFQARRGYDLREHLPALFGDGPEDAVARVKNDYRQTISDLHLAYIRRWTDWCHGHGSLSRNQAHGAPGNLLDLYAAADIPETEIFGAIDESLIPMLKFASSAAHVTGRTLSSSESFTWLREHFQTSLSDVKQAADYLFLSGVNHMFFHGIPYSPADAPWPGWQFYAAVNFGPQGGLWHDLPSFNAYVTRCQSILQSGRPANDVLLYFPLRDLFQEPKELLIPLTVHNVERWLAPHPFYKAAMAMWERGYGFDFISDQFLAQAQANPGRVEVGGNAYRAVVVPQCQVMEPATLARLVDLARAGSTILVLGDLASDVPGWGDLEERRAKLNNIRQPIHAEPLPGTELRRAAVGQGTFLFGTNVDDLLRQAGIDREPCVDSGLRFVRRAHDGGYHYFLANRGDQPVDRWVPLGAKAESIIWLDPEFPQHSGVAATRPGPGGNAEVYVQLPPGKSCVLRTFTGQTVTGPAKTYIEPSGEPRAISGQWHVAFLEGGPEKPADIVTGKLASWTTLGDTNAQRFAGTARYTIEFDRPPANAGDWVLDLGKVCETARLTLNGRRVGTLWNAPFRVRVGQFLQPGENRLEVEVTNLAANRIRDLDRRKVNWKYFYDINVASKRYRSLDASDMAAL